MNILEIKISRYTRKLYGVKLFENDNLLVIEINPVDYVLDGICFINKKYIKEVNEVKDILKHEILNNKLNTNKFDYDRFINIYEVVKYFQENKKLIKLGLDSQYYSLIGQVLRINNKSFFLKILSVKAVYLNEILIEYNKIRTITLNDDYLDSLENYLMRNKI